MKKELFNTVIYQVYVRNYTPKGDFKSLIEKLDYIKDLGVDILYLLPIHEIGVKGKKGSLGCPYSIKDYYSINHELGTLDDFKELIKETHKRGMKLMMDIVFNHTSRDSILIKEHEDFYYHRPDGSLGNKVGDWYDVYDLDHTHPNLDKYLVENIKYWVSLGVDGFRFDVCSLIPMSFFRDLRKEIGDDIILLGESVELGFIKFMRSIHSSNATDSELYECFDMLYPYDIWGHVENYFHKQDLESLNIFKIKLEEQYYSLPEKAIKINCLENHDRPRIASYFKDNALYNITALSYFNKGCAFIYGGQEVKDTHLPSLFDKDDINMEVKDKDFLNFTKTLIKFKHEKYNKDIVDTTFIQDNKNGSIIAVNNYDTFKLIGLFNLTNNELELSNEILEDGKYIDVLTNNEFEIKNNSIKITKPLFLRKI